MFRLLCVLSVLFIFSPLHAQDSLPTITTQNAESLTPIVTMGRGQPTFVTFSPDGTTLVVGSSIGVWLYDTADLSAPPQQFWMDIRATAVAFSPAGGLIGVGAGDGTGRVFDLATNRQLDYVVAGPVPERGAMSNFNVPVTQIMFSTVKGEGHKTSGFGSVSPNPVTDRDGAVLYLDVELGGEFRTDPTTATSVDGLTATISGHTVTVGEQILAGFTPSFRYATMDRAFIAEWMGEDVALPAEATWLMTSGLETSMVWDIETGELLAERTQDNSPAEMISAQSGDFEARVERFDNGITLENLTTGEEVLLVDDLNADYAAQITALSFSPDGALLAVGRFDTNLVLWDMATREVITAQYAHFGAVMALDWSPDGTVLYSGGEDNRIFAWELTDAAEFPLQQRAFLGGHAAPVINVWALDDGARMVSVSLDGSALVWGIVE